MPTWSLIVVLAFACVIIVYSVRRVKQAVQNDTLLVTTAQARVRRVGGRNVNMLTGLMGGSNSFFQNVNRECYVTFELLTDGKQVEFTIPIVDCPEIEEGDTGTLTFQGTRFVDFE